MESQYQKTLSKLERFLSPAVARALLSRTLKEHNVNPVRLSKGDLIRMGTDLRRGVRLFVDEARRAQADAELAEYCGGNAQLPSSVEVKVEAEFDIGRARAEARRICTDCGANPFSMQRIATVVSELARNMVLYAGGGELTMTPRQKANGSLSSPGACICIVAKDRGPGIPDLDHVLSGKYKSKTGMGRGLLGTKRLAESFHVTTGSQGTTITVEIAL
jgi:serine/threonine-protein kinase RsbT